jgi:hypothetical protein
LLPLDAYYGNMASHESMAMFFALLGLLLYHRWLLKPTRGSLLSMLAALALGAFAGYAGFYMIGCLGLHYVLTRPLKWTTLRFVLGMGALGLVLFGAWVLYAALLLGSPGTFLAGWNLRTDSSDSAQFTYGAWYALEYMRMRDFFTPVLRLLVVVWAGFFTCDLLRRSRLRDWAKHSFLGVLLLFGLPQVVVFRQGAWVHEYWLIFLVPFVSISAAVAVAEIGRTWLRGRKALIMALVVSVWALYALAAIGQLQTFYQPRDQAETRLARDLHDHTALDEGIMLGFEVAQPYFDYYLDRRLDAATDLESFQRLLAGGRYRFCVLRAPRTVDERWVQALMRNYPARAFEDYVIFDLKEAGDRLVQTGAQPEHVVNHDVAPGVELVGYDGPAAIRLGEPPDQGVLGRYLYSTSYEADPTWRQVNARLYWRAGEGIRGDVQPTVQLVGNDGRKRYRIAAKYAPVLSTYSTGLWQSGEWITAPYCFELGEDDPAGVYQLELVGKTDADAVVLGRIAVERGLVLPGSAVQPAAGHELTATVGNGVDLAGYTLARESYTAGETIELQTVWHATAAGEGRTVSTCLLNGDYELCRAIGVIGGPEWPAGQYFERTTSLPLHPAMLGGRYKLALKVGGDTWQAVQLGEVDIKEKMRVWPLYSEGQPDYEGGQLLKPDNALRIKYVLDGQAAVRLVVDWTGRAELTRTRVEAYRLDQGGGPDEFLGTNEVHNGAPNRSVWTISKRLAVSGTNVVELRVAQEAEGIHRLGWRGWLDRWLPDLLDEAIGPRAGTIQIDALDVERDWADVWPAYRSTIQLYAGQKMWSEAARMLQEAMAKGIQPQAIGDVGLLEGVAQAGRLDWLKAEAQKNLERLIPHRVGVSFGGKLRLEGYDFKRNGRRVEGRLYVRCLAKLDQDWTLWLHAVPEDPAVLAPQDRSAGYVTLDTLLPARTWEPGQLVEVGLPSVLRPGRYQIKLGLWRGAEDTRLFRDDQPAEHELGLGWVDIR